MSLAHARALLGEREPVVERFDPMGDREKLEELCSWALRFSPHVSPCPPCSPGPSGSPEGLLLDVTGSERLFGSEERLLEDVVTSIEARAFDARASIASTLGCAWGVACFGGERWVRVPAGEEAVALGSLPVAALRLEPEVVNALAEVGIERVAELYGLPRDALPARFGSELLLRLDQARGAAFEAFVPLRPKRVPHAARSFEAPVGLEAVAYTLRAELRELCLELVQRGESALSLELELTCSEAAPIFEKIVLSRPHTDFEHLWSLIAPLLERAQLGFGVERVALSASRTVRAVGQQVTAWGSGSRRHLGRELAELLDTLASRLGRESILGVRAVESHLPESAFRALPCSEAWEHAGRDSAGEARITTLPRPSRLFTPPERIEVETGAGGEPVRFRKSGELHGIVRRFGPERIAVPWWRGAGSPGDRDYFCVQDHQGRWLWLVLDVNGLWFLHGEWL